MGGEKRELREYNVMQAYAALGIGFVCLGIGLPLWWKTTQVYRVQLPYSDIDSLSQRSLQISVTVEVISFIDALSSTDLTLLTQQLHSHSESQNEDTFISIDLKLSSHQALPDELNAYKKSTNIHDDNTELSTLLKSVDAPNKYRLILFPQNSHIQHKYPYIGTSRSIFLEFINVKETSHQASSILHSLILQQSSLVKKYDSVRATKRQSPDKESMRSVKSSLGYDVTFTLVLHEPHILDVQWNIRQHINDYLKPFITKLPIAINVKSQVLSYTSLLLRPEKGDNSSFYRHSDLPHMINPLESRLETYSNS